MQKIVIASVILVLLVCLTKTASLGAKKDPELDRLLGMVDEYLRNEGILNSKLKCLMNEGPCDTIGKLLKPRLTRALLGDCVVCSPLQKEMMDKYLEEFQKNRPAVYRHLFVQFLEKAGIKVDDAKKSEILQNEKIEEATRYKYIIQDTAELKDIQTKIIMLNTTTKNS